MLTCEPKNRRSEGFEAEKIVARILEGRGWQIIGTNFQTRYGEIDIIAKENNALVFIEVKSSKRTDIPPMMRVNKRKQERMILTAEQYLLENQDVAYREVRFDVVSMIRRAGGEWEFYHIPNAFIRNMDI